MNGKNRVLVVKCTMGTTVFVFFAPAEWRAQLLDHAMVVSNDLCFWTDFVQQICKVILLVSPPFTLQGFVSESPHIFIETGFQQILKILSLSEQTPFPKGKGKNKMRGPKHPITKQCPKVESPIGAPKKSNEDRPKWSTKQLKTQNRHQLHEAYSTRWVVNLKVQLTLKKSPLNNDLFQYGTDLNFLQSYSYSNCKLLAKPIDKDLHSPWLTCQ